MVKFLVFRLVYFPKGITLILWTTKCMDVRIDEYLQIDKYLQDQ